MKELLNEWRRFLNEGYAFVDPDGEPRELPDEIIKVYLGALGKHNLGALHNEHHADNPDYYPPRAGAFYIVAEDVIKGLNIDYSKYGEGSNLAAVLQKYAKENQLHLKYDMHEGEDTY
tara:strand:+ start:32 stop:385 length:354 start_codon:yes stop_codon:yes gene_type:complete